MGRYGKNDRSEQIERNKEIVKLIDSGRSRLSVARKFNVTISRIGYIFKTADIKRRIKSGDL